MGGTDRESPRSLHIAGWYVDVAGNRLQRDGITKRVEPKVMQLLTCLVARAGEVVTREELTNAVWPGMFVTDDALTGAVIKLRKAFADDSRHPRVIETVPKVGYRLIADVAGNEHTTEENDARHGTGTLSDPVVFDVTLAQRK